MDFNLEYKKRVKLIDDYILNYLESIKGVDESIKDGLKYSVLNGGKRIRSILCLETYKLWRDDIQVVLPFAMAIEFIHAYSLVHDDLPAMDNADMRRNMPSCHKKYGEATAILIGDALLNLAFEVMANTCLDGDVNKVKAMSKIASCSGIFGMINGQATDLRLVSNKNVSEDELKYLIEQKTGALIKASAVSGAILASADEEKISNIEKYAYHLGMAFQIRDDIEDEKEDESDAQDSPNFLNVLGKDLAIKTLDYHRKASDKYILRFKHNQFLSNMNEYLF